jgi:O-antigen/teichoic acid export membrane protein|tara:strand:+ start:191 stop:1633 length:1443 start_codon:yes stop_codon:yes gene_type:complete
MDTIRRISKNLFFQSTSEIIVKGLQILIFIYIARFLRETEFGKFNFAIAFTAIALIFIDIGLRPLFIREISRKREIAEKYIFHSIIIKSVLSVIVFLIVIFFMNLIGYPQDIRILVYIMFAAIILKSFTDVFSTVFLAFEQMQWDGLFKTLRAVLLTILVFSVLFMGQGIIIIAWMYVITELFILALCLFVLFTKFIKLVVKVEKGFIKKLSFEAFPFALTVLFYSLYFYISSIMLLKMRGVYDVGIFSAAYNITTAFIFIPTIYITAIFPTLSKFYINSKDSLKFAYKKSLLYISIIALPITIVLFFLGDNIIHFLYGAGYHNSAFVLKIIAITILLRFISFVNGVTIISINKQKQRLYFQGATAFLNIILNFILIPLFGLIGVAFATIISEFFLNASYFFIVINYFKNWKDILILIKPFIAVIVASSLFFVGIDTIWVILMVLISYVALLLIFKVFNKEDLNIFKRVSQVLFLRKRNF